MEIDKNFIEKHGKRIKIPMTGEGQYLFRDGCMLRLTKEIDKIFK